MAAKTNRTAASAAKIAAEEAAKGARGSAQPLPGDLPTKAAIPPAPLKATLIKPNETTVIYKGMLASEISMIYPAMASFSALATRNVGDLSMNSGLGTHRPPKVRLGVDDTKQFLYVLPTGSEDTAGFEVSYDRQRIKINLIETFTKLDRAVPEGRTEYYYLVPTPGPVTLDDGFTAPGFSIYLKPHKSEPRRTMSPEAKAKRAATIARKKAAEAAKKTAGGAAAGEAN